MTKELFADTISGIGINKGVIRMDFVSQSATEKNAKGQPLDEFRQRIVMPVEGFLRMQAMMQSMMQKLQDAGALTPRQPNGAPKIMPPPAAPKKR